MSRAATGTCVRCCQTVSRNRGANWPEGFVCRRCYQQATRRHGCCPGCRTARLLPGLSPTGDPICADCAGLPKNFHCKSCGQEADPYRFGLCVRCVIRADLSIALDDGTNHVSPVLRPLFDAICQQPNALSAILWLRKPPVRDLLHQLAVGAVPISRETFSSHPHPLMATHLRDLLIEHGVLAPVNRDLVAFEDWLTRHLPAYPPAAEKLLRGFATWHHLRRMRDLADQAKLTRRTVYAAEQQITVAVQFLDFLDTRKVTYNQLRQADVDTWLATGPTTRYAARTFVRWAGSTRRLPVVRFPNRSDRNPPDPGPTGTASPTGSLFSARHRPVERSHRRDPGPALRPTCHPNKPAPPDERRRRRNQHDGFFRHGGRTAAGTSSRPVPRAPREPPQHGHRSKHRFPMALPGSPSRPADYRQLDDNRGSTTSASDPSPPATAHSGNS